jgi:hypothetical protein
LLPLRVVYIHSHEPVLGITRAKALVPRTAEPVRSQKPEIAWSGHDRGLPIPSGFCPLNSIRRATWSDQEFDPLAKGRLNHLIFGALPIAET